MSALPQCRFDGCAALAHGILGGICPAGHVSMLPLCGEHLRAWHGFLGVNPGHPRSWVCGCSQAMAETMTEVYL